MDTRYCLVTGCGKGGIGSALVEEFVRRGYHTFATLLPGEPRQHLEKRDSITICDLDLTKEDMVAELAAQISTRTKDRLDVLVNNAGIIYTIPAVDADISHTRKLFDVNVFGPMLMVHYLHRQIIAAQGRVINVSSIAGVSPYVYGSVYNASKAALVHFMDTLRVEMTPLGVKVINIISGEVQTDILRHDRERSLPPDSVYFPLNDEFRAHCLRTPPNRSSPEDYARAVVEETLKESPKRWFWWGAQTTIVWICHTFLGHGIWERVFIPQFNLNKLKSMK